MSPRRILALLAALILVLPALSGEMERYELDNGLEILMKEAHGGPMVASIVTIGAGARWEDASSYGASHYLEHMVFNGTPTRSREDINEGIKEIGGYINAFTRREYTCYILLIPSEYLREGLEIQADMLYASTLPPEEFAKEKLVVLEEMRKDLDSGSYAGENLRRSVLLGGTPYEHPILGTFDTINAQDRDSVYDYYRRQYVPANSRVFLVGDFEPAAARALMNDVFGVHEGEKPEAPRALSLNWISEPSFDWIHVDEGQTRLSFTWPVPGIETGDYPAQLVLANLLSDPHRSPLAGLDAGFSVELFEGFSLMNMDIEINEGSVADVLSDLADRMPALAQWVPEAELVAEAAHGLRVEDSFLADTYHYFAMMKSAELHLGGFPFLSGYLDELQSLKSAQVRHALESGILAGPPKIIVMSQEDEPAPPTRKQLAAFQGSDVELKLAGGLPQSKWQRAMAMIQGDGSPARTKKLETRREVLPNGMTLLVKSDPGSEVFASHLLVRGRSLMEPSGKAGMVDLMQRLLTAGTDQHSEEEIDALLGSMGAQIKVSDNPWIPFDNYYSREDFSFIRLETLDESADEALNLLAEMIGEASFPEAAFERERGKMIGALSMGGSKPSDAARAASYEAIFSGGPRGNALTGSPRSLGMISPDDLRNFRARYYDPARMILSVATGLPMDDALAILRREFGGFKALGEALPATELSTGPEEIVLPMDKQQVALRATRLLPESAALDPSLPALVSILSARLALELREKQGLAYSVGASLGSRPGLAEDEPGFSLLVMAMSTGADNRDVAMAGMRAELQRMVDDPPSSREIYRAVNGTWGRLLMRNLSRIYQAYSMGLAAHLGEDPFAAPGGNIDRQREASPQELSALAKEILLADDWIWVMAGGGLE